MARPRRIDPNLVVQAQEVAAKTDDIRELRMAQAVLLPALGQLTLEETAKAIGVGRATVARLQRSFQQRSEQPHLSRRRWGGGRRRALMTPQQEEAFLDEWRAKAEAGELVTMTEMHQHLERKLGRKVKRSVLYRLLERHKWRKVAPDTRHPKGDPEVQDQWKKKRFPKSWRPC